jgi:uncharacterized protein
VPTMTDDRVERLRRQLRALYAERAADLPYHGWHHVAFVSAKAVAFARELGADECRAEVAGLVHDLNYLVDPTTAAAAGEDLRRRFLAGAGFEPAEIEVIETIVLEAETGRRDAAISVEAQALSDADTLFKSLPITPVVLAPRYLAETGRSLRELAEGIVRDQVPLDASGIYFYSAGARRRYAAWGTTNLQLWRYILDSLDDPDVADLLELIEDD